MNHFSINLSHTPSFKGIQTLYTHNHKRTQKRPSRITQQRMDLIYTINCKDKQEDEHQSSSQAAHNYYISLINYAHNYICIHGGEKVLQIEFNELASEATVSH